METEPAMNDPLGDASLIAFFDLETTMPPDRIIIEFGAILVCPRKLVEKCCYSTLVRPDDLSVITPHFESKGITLEEVAKAPSFARVAHKVFELLHGRTWAGHYIEEFDCPRIVEAFQKIGRQPPEPKGVIDTCSLLAETFGRRAGDMKLASLASYFGLGEQPHRSVADARMALQVFKNCGAVLFLESKFPEVLQKEAWLSPDCVSVSSIRVSLELYRGNPKIQILHNGVRLRIHCDRMSVRYGPKNRSSLSIVVDAPESLCGVLDSCNDQAYKLFELSGSTAKWNDVITAYAGIDNVRLRIRRETEVFLKGRDDYEEPIQISDEQEIVELFQPKTSIEAFFSVDTYDCGGNAGIALVAEELVVDF